MTQPLPIQPPDTPSRLVREQLLPLVAGLEHSDLYWLAGYAAGLAQGRMGGAMALPAVSATTAAAPVAATPASLTVLVASQTGNSKRQGERLLAAATAAGLNARLVRAADYSLKELARERLLFVVISTQGDGDPPDEARALFDQLLSKRAPKLPQLHFAVLSLGDSSYPKFCAAGQIFDERLLALGAQRLHDRADCDLDIETLATPWIHGSIERAREQFAELRIATVTPLRGATVGAPQTAAEHASGPSASRESPFAAEVLAVQRLTGRGSEREVYHLELALGDSGLRYEPGDALGILPRNPLESVQAVLEATRLDGDQSVTRDGITLPLAEWLTSRLEITQVSRPTLLALQERRASAALQELLAPASREALRNRMLRSQVADFLRDFPADWDATSLLAALRPLAPRLYSIASSRASVGDEVHTTVALVGDGAASRPNPGNPRWGAASRFVATHSVDGSMPIFIETNDRFRLPRDGTRDIIMVGPGTGVAPFRAFVQERAETGASGRNWLLFGARSFDHDFLYQLEWQAALKQKTLHRLDLAFSRDQAEKIYVQHRLLAAGHDVWDWLQNGANFYVCGDATRMAPDVNAALLQIGRQHGNLSDDSAVEWLAALTAEGRYLRDVY